MKKTTLIKVLVLLLCISVAMAFTACGKSDNDKKAKDKSSVSKTATAANPALSNDVHDILFDANYYVNKYSDLKNAFGNNEAKLRNHWNTYGKKEGRSPSCLFDAKYYLNRYSDLKKAFGNDYTKAYNHFVTYGIREGRQGSPDFYVLVYKGNYKDLRNAFKDNHLFYLKHWREYGQREGRNATKSISRSVPQRMIADGWYSIVSANNNNYALDIRGGGTGDGVNLQLWQKNDSAAQKFYLSYNYGDGFYTIKSKVSGKYIHIQDEHNKHCNVHQWSGNGNTNSHWYLENAGGGYYYLRNRSTSSYLDNAAGTVKDGNNVQTWDLNRSNAQKWKFISTTENTPGSNPAPAPAPSPSPAPAPNGGNNVNPALQWCESLVGKKVGTGQCVALIKAYYQHLGVAPATGNAYQYASNRLPAGWQRVQGGVPQAGDILIYAGAKYGHVAIYAGGTASYHQNMSGKYVEKKTNWNYNKSWYSKAEGGTKYYWGYIRPRF